MEKIKENFGRRIALVGGGIIAILIALVMVAAFTVQAKAADGRSADTDPYNPNQNSLTALVHAGVGEAFEASFSYTVTPVSFGGSTAAADLAKMPTLTIPALQIAVDTSGTATTSTTNATVADRNAKMFRDGAGSRTATTIGYDLQYAENEEVAGETYWSWEAEPQKCYFVQLPFSEVVNAASPAWTTPGEYKYKILESGVTSTQVTKKSDAEYDLRILVSDTTPQAAAPTIAVTGYILAQNKHDDGLALHIDKKDPRRGFGNSNHLHAVENPAQGEATHYYYGFTYSHITSAGSQPFYVQKIVDNNAPDLTINFPITLSFYNTSFTGASTEAPVGVIGDVAYADRFKDNATVTGLSVVNFTWGKDPAGDDCWSATFNLKHLQRICFDAKTAFSGTTSTELPVYTGYTCLEDMETAQTPTVDYSKYTAKAKAYTQVGSVDGQSQMWTASGGTAADTKGAGKNMYVTYWDYEVTGATAGTWDNNNQAYVSKAETKTHDNKVVITNIYDYTPSNFWLDILPYIIMIGIPLAAFVIWMLARRKKLNS